MASRSTEHEPLVPSSLTLIPWDPESATHVQRLLDQRVACGWKQNYIEKWAKGQREGEMGMYWIALSSSEVSPRAVGLLDKHETAFPAEATPLRDSAVRILGRSRGPGAGSPTFTPIGHICLEAVNEDALLETSRVTGTYSLSAFYVSRALQSAGLGSLALEACERLAAESLGARALTLDTIDNAENVVDSPRRIAMRKPPSPVGSHHHHQHSESMKWFDGMFQLTGEITHISQFSVQDWYERRGYVVYARNDAGFFDVDDTGKEWAVKTVYLRKKLLPAACDHA